MKDYERVWRTKPEGRFELTPFDRRHGLMDARILADRVREHILWLEFETHVKPRIIAAMNQMLWLCWWRRYKKRRHNPILHRV